jgi:MFS family permease
MPLPLEKRNVLLLSAAQALVQTTSILMVTVAGIIGFSFAPNPSWSTLPISMMMVGAAVTTIPASLLMRRHGRKTGFLMGIAFGMLAAGLAAWAVMRADFMLFILANLCVGAYQGFAQFYRFAAGEAAGEAFRSRAVSWVVGGGVVAAVAGPNIARLTGNLGETPFLWSFLVLFALGIMAALIISGLRLPPTQEVHATDASRPLSEITSQLTFLTALAGSVVGFSVMVMVMTATPLAMHLCGLPMGHTTTVIQWHVLGMFLPSFFTGHLIRRFGVLPMMACGVILMMMHVAVALSGIEFAHFLSGLVLVGIGWNLMFIGGTTLLADTYRPSERAKVQGVHDFLVNIGLTTASLSAGVLLSQGGWRMVNVLALPALVITMLLILALALRRKGALRTPGGEELV